MAQRTESKKNAIEDAVYHDVDNNELSMLLRVKQTSENICHRKITEVNQKQRLFPSTIFGTKGM